MQSANVREATKKKSEIWDIVPTGRGGEKLNYWVGLGPDLTDFSEKKENLADFKVSGGPNFWTFSLIASLTK